MSSSQSEPALEICANCGQQTAPQFFRKVGAKQICVLCAQRSAESDKALKEAIEDDKLHGGYGWLWKHIAYTAYASVGGLVLRYLIKSYLVTH
jgi:hypothetical protein